MQLNRNHFAELFRVDYKTVEVVFNESKSTNPKTYTYKLAKDEDVKVGDQVLVEVTNYSGKEYKLVTVVTVNETPAIDGQASFNYKWALGGVSALIAKRDANIEKDQRLKAGVARLEQLLAAQEIRQRLVAAVGTLNEADRKELQELFGDALVLPQLSVEPAATGTIQA